MNEDFINRMEGVHGSRGRAWAEALPELLESLCHRWRLEQGEPLGGPSFNYVVPATDDAGRQVILKVGVPCHEMRCEIAALRWFDGNGAVRLLDADEECGAMLLERLCPGTDLLELDDQAATSAFCSAARSFWRSPPTDHDFPTIADWGQGFDRVGASHPGALDRALTDRARAMFDELVRSADEPVLLHGDLHHQNVLAADRAPWLVIDPKGVIGERAYEAGAFLRNPLPQLLRHGSARQTSARRVAQMAEELNLDRDRIARWAFSQAVLSAWWCIEDSCSGWRETMELAEILGELC